MALGIDLGATHLKGLALTPVGGVVGQFTRPSLDGCGIWREEHVRNVVNELARYCDGRPRWIGLAAPGLVAPDHRSVVCLPGRLLGLEGLRWDECLPTHAQVSVLNDAQAALLGEAWLGAARGHRNVLMVTLGTGVGGAVICDGRLLSGHLGRAGHLGHISLDPGGAPDIVSTPGSLEDAIGDCTIRIRSQGRFKTTLDLVAEARQGDQAALAIWARSVRYLAAALASFINLFDPELIVIGGGIAQAGDLLFGPLEHWLRQSEWQINGFRVPVVPAQLGELAGAYGAAWFAMQQHPASEE